MASKSAYRESEPGAEIQELLDNLDTALDRLKVMYEQYFLGILKAAPSYLHTDAERKLRELSQFQIRNTGLRYRLATLQQKYGAYNTYWRRTLRQIEQGTYVRNLAKVRRQAAAQGADIPEEILAAMPKRMREQVKKDREKVAQRADEKKQLPPQRQRQPTDDYGFALEDDIAEVRSPVPRDDTMMGRVDTAEMNPIDLFADDPEAAAIAAGLSADTSASAPPWARVRAPQSQPAQQKQQPPPLPPQPPRQPTQAIPRQATQPGPPQPPPRQPTQAIPRQPTQPGLPRGTGPAPAVRTQPIPPIPQPPRPGTKPDAAVDTRMSSATLPPFTAARPGRPPTATPATPTPPSSQPPRAKPATAAAARPAPSIPPGMTEGDVRTLYQQYSRARELVGERNDDATYSALLRTLHQQAPKIMEQYGAKGVEFGVVIKDKQVILKAKPKP